MTADDDALNRAYDLARSYPQRAEQLASMVREDGIAYAKRFAAYLVQTHNLGLKPLENAPCHGDPDGSNPEDRLLRRLLTAGLSRYEPDPLVKLAKVKG
jgi:hypothetical protein